MGLLVQMVGLRKTGRNLGMDTDLRKIFDGVQDGCMRGATRLQVTENRLRAAG
jgi:hypothetical protein